MENAEEREQAPYPPCPGPAASAESAHEGNCVHHDHDILRFVSLGFLCNELGTGVDGIHEKKTNRDPERARSCQAQISRSTIREHRN